MTLTAWVHSLRASAALPRSSALLPALRWFSALWDRSLSVAMAAKARPLGAALASERTFFRAAAAAVPAMPSAAKAIESIEPGFTVMERSCYSHYFESNSRIRLKDGLSEECRRCAGLSADLSR